MLPKAIGLSLGKEILVHKGGAKKHATKEWFQEQYYDNSRLMKVEVDQPRQNAIFSDHKCSKDI